MIILNKDGWLAFPRGVVPQTKTNVQALLCLRCD